MKTVYFGNNKDIFDSLYKNSEIVGAVIKNAPDSDYWISPLKNDLVTKGILTYSPDTLKNQDELYSALLDKNPDLLVCCGYHLKIPQRFLDIPKVASINVHPAFLPKYRGQHVIQWALINGEKYSGVTLHHMTDKFDEGDIINQRQIEILPEDNALTLHSKIHKTGANLLEDVLKKLDSGQPISRIPQNHSEATYFNARKPEDGKIDWDKTPEEIHNLIRSLVHPWPGAYMEHDGQKLIIDGFEFEKLLDNNKDFPSMQGDKKLRIIGRHGLYTIDPKNIRNYNEYHHK